MKLYRKYQRYNIYVLYHIFQNKLAVCRVTITQRKAWSSLSGRAIHTYVGCSRIPILPSNEGERKCKRE